jgi:hypothetical protein
VILDLHVVVGEGLGYVRLAHNGRAIDERAGLDQRAFDQNCVIGRDAKIARWHVLSNRV